MILPHLSHDWEAGRRSEVSARMNLTLKLLGLLLFAGSIAILLAAPFLFDVAFDGKFARRTGCASLDADLLLLVRHGDDGANVLVVRRASPA